MLTIRSGLGSAAAVAATVGDGVGAGVTVGMGSAVRVGATVGATVLGGVGAFEQAQDASKPVTTNANARSFPGANAGLRPDRARLVNSNASYRFLQTM